MFPFAFPPHKWASIEFCGGPLLKKHDTFLLMVGYFVAFLFIYFFD